MIERIDHREKLANRVTTDLQTDTFLKLVDVYAKEIQEVEDAFLMLAGMKDLDTAFGIWLDFLGKVLGDDRAGRDDDTYREALKLRIRINSADGTPNTIIGLVKDFTEATDVKVTQSTVASGCIYTNGTTNLDETLTQLVKDIIPVGTRFTVMVDGGSAFRPAWESNIREGVPSATGNSNTTQLGQYTEVDGVDYYPNSLVKSTLNSEVSTPVELNVGDDTTTVSPLYVADVNETNILYLSDTSILEEEGVTFCWELT